MRKAVSFGRARACRTRLRSSGGTPLISRSMAKSSASRTSASAAIGEDRKSTRLNSSHLGISYAVFCLILRLPRSPLFPYTTLFRSGKGAVRREASLLSFEPDAQGRQLRKGSRLPHPSSFVGWHPLDLALDGEELSEPHECFGSDRRRSEEHTSELQSLRHLVCRLLLDPATSQISALSLHDALPIWQGCCPKRGLVAELRARCARPSASEGLALAAPVFVRRVAPP